MIGIVSSPALTKYGNDGNEIDLERANGQRNKLQNNTPRSKAKFANPSATAYTLPLKV